jgi:hypothetical protein
MFFQRFLLISAAAVCGTISMWAQGAAPPTGITRNYLFAPIGLGSSETASITVVNTATASPYGGTIGTPAAAPSCTGTISFSNANGAIGTPTSFTLGSEQFKTVTLPVASGGLTGNRGEIQGKVSLTISTPTVTPCSLMFSMETYDSGTGATHAVLSASLASFGPVGPVGPILPIVGPGYR